jgi:hypothetical protein
VLSLASALVIVSGCGSGGPSAKDQIAAVVKQEGTNPSSLCAHLVNSLVARIGGKRACLRQAASAARDPSTRATSITIHGSTATAAVADRTGSRTISFVRQKGVWKVAGVH